MQQQRRWIQYSIQPQQRVWTLLSWCHGWLDLITDLSQDSQRAVDRVNHYLAHGVDRSATEETYTQGRGEERAGSFVCACDASSRTTPQKKKLTRTHYDISRPQARKLNCGHPPKWQRSHPPQEAVRAIPKVQTTDSSKKTRHN